jgi:RNA polymerase sigma-70 factor (ECF subfamily)
MGKTTNMTKPVDQSRFLACIEQHRKIVYKVANAYAASAEDRKDLAQDITVQLWLAYPKYDEQRSFSTWMYRIALNIAMSFSRDHQRRVARQKQLELAEETTQAPSMVEGDERIALLHRTIASLDELNRALILMYLDERSYKDIADVLGISETNVSTKINRLKQHLCELLTDSIH